jgi:hypothetical protein
VFGAAGRRGRAEHELRCQRAGGAGAAGEHPEPVEHLVDQGLRHQSDRLAQARQPGAGEVRQVGVVEAGDRDVPAGGGTGVGDRRQRADGEGVGGADHGGGCAVRVGEERGQGGLGGVGGVGRGGDVGRRGQSVPGQRRTPAGPALVAARAVGGPAEEGDPAVAQGDQVVDGQRGARGAVHVHPGVCRVRVAPRSAVRDVGHVVGGEPAGPPVAGVGVRHHEGVHGAAGQQVGVDGDLRVVVAVGRVEGEEPVAVRLRGAHQLVQQPVRVRGGAVRGGADPDADQPRPSGGQRAGGLVRAVAELVDRAAHPVQRAGGQPIGGVQRVGHRLPGHARVRGDVTDRDAPGRRRRAGAHGTSWHPGWQGAGGAGRRSHCDRSKPRDNPQAVLALVSKAQNECARAGQTARDRERKVAVRGAAASLG